MFKTKAKATTSCPRAVLEVEDSPRRPHPWLSVNISSYSNNYFTNSFILPISKF